MKRTFILLLCSLATLALSAQKADYYKEKKHEIRLSGGTVNDDYYHYDNYMYYSSYYGNYGAYGGGYGYYGGYAGYGYYGQLSNYQDLSIKGGDKKTSGAYALTYFYHAPWLNGRFSFGASVAYSHFSRDYTHRLQGHKVGDSKEYNLAFTPIVRYSWLAKNYFQLYSGIGVSLFYNDYKMNINSGEMVNKRSENGFEASFMVTPIGVSAGRRVFGFSEVNIGGRMGVFVAGVGYRF